MKFYTLVPHVLYGFYVTLLLINSHVPYIDVHPHAVLLADVSNALQGVEGSLYCGASCSIDEERVSALQ